MDLGGSLQFGFNLCGQAPRTDPLRQTDGQDVDGEMDFPELGEIDPKAPKGERLKQLAGLMTHPENGRFTRTIVNRIWARLMGRGIVHPVDAMDTKPWNEDLLDYLAVRFAEDGYDLRKFIGFVMTSHAYQSKSVFLSKEPGEDYVYSGPVPKRMTAEQFMDSIWQVTGTNPTKIEAKVDRAIQDESSAKPDPLALPKPGKITAKWIWGSNPNAKKIKLRKKIKLDYKPTFASFLATCDNAFSLRINGKSVTSSKEWTKPVYQQTASFFKKGDNLIEVDAEMFGGASGFVAQFILGKDKKLVETDKTWEVAEGKQWKAATEVHPYGKGPWKRVLDNAIESKTGTTPGAGPPIRAALVKNDFLMRSLGRPHRDQVVTSRPAELTTLQAIDLANGQILADYLAKGARALKGRKNGRRTDRLALPPCLGPPPLALGEKHSRGGGVRIRRQPGNGRPTLDGLHASRISNHTLSTMNLPESIIRRDFIKQLGVASAAALATEGTKAWANEAVKHPEAKADSCILIWLAGGMAAPDTFDPKRYHPFEVGLDMSKILSTFPAIDTNVDGLKITKGLENIAQVMDRGTLIRSAFQPDLGSILHSRHQYHWHTG